jgi:hypothetical protein
LPVDIRQFLCPVCKTKTLHLFSAEYLSENNNDKYLFDWCMSLSKEKKQNTIFDDKHIAFMSDLLQDHLNKYTYEDRQRLRNSLITQVEHLLNALDFFISAMKHDKSISTAAMSRTAARVVKEHGPDLDKLNINWNYVVGIDCLEKELYHKSRRRK